LSPRLGGEQRGRGAKPDGTPWWVALERPGMRARIRADLIVALHGLSVATSGDYGASSRTAAAYSHTIDPRRLPVDTGWRRWRCHPSA
jgi:thiamine biosynthesis lipoprotein